MEKIAGQESSLCSESITCSVCHASRASQRKEKMKQQQRMVIMIDLKMKIRSKGSMDAKNRWRVIELLAANCEKAWIHPGWEDTMQKW